MVRIIYVDRDHTTAEFSLSPAFDSKHDTPDLAQNSINLFKVNSINNGVTYLISSSTDILEGKATRTYTSADKILKYSTTLEEGYYVLTATYHIGNQDYIKLSYQSSSYSCPCSGKNDDYHKNFEPCTGTAGGVDPDAEEAGFPCLEYDNTAKKCTKCADDYV